MLLFYMCDSLMLHTIVVNQREINARDRFRQAGKGAGKGREEAPNVDEDREDRAQRPIPRLSPSLYLFLSALALGRGFVWGFIYHRRPIPLLLNEYDITIRLLFS